MIHHAIANELISFFLQINPKFRTKYRMTNAGEKNPIISSVVSDERNLTQTPNPIPVKNSFKVHHLIILLLLGWLYSGIIDTNMVFSNAFLYQNFHINHVSKNEGNIRVKDNLTYILLIGDSIDLFMTLDWCRAHPSRSLCHVTTSPDWDRGALYTSRPEDNCTVFANRLSTIELPATWTKDHGPGWCTDPIRNITILMYWQNFGVCPTPPWDNAYDINKFILPSTTSDMTAGQALKIVLEPILRLAPILLGNYPDGILVHSSFWDFNRQAYRDF